MFPLETAGEVCSLSAARGRMSRVLIVEPQVCDMVLSLGPVGHCGIAQLHKTPECLLPKGFWQAKALSALIYTDTQFGASSLLPALVKNLRALGWTEVAGLMSASTTLSSSPTSIPLYRLRCSVMYGIFIYRPTSLFFCNVRLSHELIRGIIPLEPPWVKCLAQRHSGGYSKLAPCGDSASSYHTTKERSQM